MESEKANEIKKWLYERSDAKLLDNSYNLVGITYGDILTLINELESEKERFLESCKNCYYIKDLEIANWHAKELKDRITELEKENTRLDKVVKHNQELIEDGKLISSEQLKQFAKIFKQKCIDAGIFPAFVARKLEETLEEFISNESNN